MLTRRAVLALAAVLLGGALCGCTDGAGQVMDGDGMVNDAEPAGAAARFTRADTGEYGYIAEDDVAAYTQRFREGHLYDDDATWAQYLVEQGLDAAGWRYRVIGVLVDDELVRERAAQLGIEADEAAVDEQIEAEIAYYVGREAWEASLALAGYDAEGYRDHLIAENLEAQLEAAEIDFSVEDDEAEIDAFIEQNLTSRVVRRWSLLLFDDQAAAQAALDALAAVPADELEAAFAEAAEGDASDATTAANGGDAGWDLAADWGAMQQELNAEKVDAGALSAQVHELDEGWAVARCTARFVFEAGTAYADLPDDDLKQIVYNATLQSVWSQRVADYVAGLREAAQVQVREAPADLPYDVDDLVAELEGGAQ